GAIVYLDNDEKGVAPVLLEDVVKGDHELSVFMPGFFRRTQKINIDPGYQVNAIFKLAIDQSSSLSEKTQKKTTTTITPGKEATSSAKTGKTTILIKDTPTGFLRVREEPSIETTEEAQVKPGDEFDLLDEETGWYKIEYEKGKQGWVYSQYAEKQEE
ncbi:SH3 domain-containing protein, partial [Candidatus Roizmanbacteria bacterium]|nr:SH3 domain-containing protein [Candidatus Roizmanbacteria bacterium]